MNYAANLNNTERITEAVYSQAFLHVTFLRYPHCVNVLYGL